MFQCFVQCYPWDLLDEGVEHVLDMLQGQAGASGVTLVLACDQLEQFRPHAGIEPKIYRGSGGVFFQPNLDHYSATPLKPPRWEQHRNLDALAKVFEACATRALDLRLSVSPFHSHRLVHKHPAIAARNAFGVDSRSALCLAHPDVREYLMAVVRDLSASYEASGLVLEEVQWPPATDTVPYLQAMALLFSDVAALLNVCFNESSMRAASAAGVDAPAALRCTRSLLERFCREGVGRQTALPEVMERNPAVARYIDWAESYLLGLLRDMKQASGMPLMLSLGGASQSITDMSYAAGLIELADRFIADADDLEEAMMTFRHSVGELELLLALDEGAIDQAPDAVRQISRAAESGLSGITVTHYGALRNHQFEWIHQGLRNARRLR